MLNKIANNIKPLLKDCIAQCRATRAWRAYHTNKLLYNCLRQQYVMKAMSVTSVFIYQSQLGNDKLIYSVMDVLPSSYRHVCETVFVCGNRAWLDYVNSERGNKLIMLSSIIFFIYFKLGCSYSKYFITNTIISTIHI